MSPIEIGVASVVLIVLLIYAGLYIAVALGLVSFLGVWIMRGDVRLPIVLLALAAADTVSHQVFATVPLFALMGLLVSKAGLGNDVYRVGDDEEFARRPLALAHWREIGRAGKAGARGAMAAAVGADLDAIRKRKHVSAVDSRHGAKGRGVARDGPIRKSASAAGSNEALRPWDAEGVSRRTWYRRRAALKAGGTKAKNPVGTKAKKRGEYGIYPAGIIYRITP